MQYQSVEMSTDKLLVNSIVAKDVVNRVGFLLVTKDTMLNSKIINHLKTNKIPSVFIKTADYTPFEAKAFTTLPPNKTISVPERAEFKVFEKTYDVKAEELKKSVLEISNGGAIDLESLYSTTNGVMSSISLQSDIFTYLNFLKVKDEYTFSHSLNVSLLCNLFGRWLGLPYDDLVTLTVAGLLHDVGKTKIDNKILNNPKKLSSDEFKIIKTHTSLGYKMLFSQKISPKIKDAVLMHHERIDGSGYPLGLYGDQISDYAKIVSICDIYDAMTADRIYRGRLCPFEVIRTFEQNLYGELDTQYLLIFLKNIAYTHTSANVILSNGQEGIVVFINNHDLSRPVIRVRDSFIDLSNERDLTIKELK